MHCIKQGCLVPTSPLVFFIRFYRSAYRLKPGSLKSVKLEENKTGEKSFAFMNCWASAAVKSLLIAIYKLPQCTVYTSLIDKLNRCF